MLDLRSNISQCFPPIKVTVYFDWHRRSDYQKSQWNVCCPKVHHCWHPNVKQNIIVGTQGWSDQNNHTLDVRSMYQFSGHKTHRIVPTFSLMLWKCCSRMIWWSSLVEACIWPRHDIACMIRRLPMHTDNKMIVSPVYGKRIDVDLKSSEIFSDVVVAQSLFALSENDQDFFDIV